MINLTYIILRCVKNQFTLSIISINVMRLNDYSDLNVKFCAICDLSWHGYRKFCFFLNTIIHLWWIIKISLHFNRNKNPPFSLARFHEDSEFNSVISQLGPVSLPSNGWGPRLQPPLPDRGKYPFIFLVYHRLCPIRRKLW